MPSVYIIVLSEEDERSIVNCIYEILSPAAIDDETLSLSDQDLVVESTTVSSSSVLSTTIDEHSKQSLISNHETPVITNPSSEAIVAGVVEVSKSSKSKTSKKSSQCAGQLAALKMMILCYNSIPRWLKYRYLFTKIERQ